jgi:tRNA splicing endonuclease
MTLLVNKEDDFLRQDSVVTRRRRDKGWKMAFTAAYKTLGSVGFVVRDGRQRGSCATMAISKLGGRRR